MWQHSQRPPAQFILRIQLNCHGGSRETTCAVGTASRKRWRIDRDLFYFDLPPQQILKDTSGEHDAINAGSCGARGGPLARVLESVGTLSATIEFSTSRRQRDVFASKPLQKINKLGTFSSTYG